MPCILLIVNKQFCLSPSVLHAHTPEYTQGQEFILFLSLLFTVTYSEPRKMLVTELTVNEYLLNEWMNERMPQRQSFLWRKYFALFSQPVYLEARSSNCSVNSHFYSKVGERPGKQLRDGVQHVGQNHRGTFWAALGSVFMGLNQHSRHTQET